MLPRGSKFNYCCVLLLLSLFPSFPVFSTSSKLLPFLPPLSPFLPFSLLVLRNDLSYLDNDNRVKIDKDIKIEIEVQETGALLYIEIYKKRFCTKRDMG